MLKKLAFGLVMAVATVGTYAQAITDISANTTDSAYLQDSRGTIARSAYGLCWRSGNWNPSDAVLGCDGDLAPPVAKSIAPAFVSSNTENVPAAPISAQRCDFSVALANDQAFGFDKAALTNAAKKRIDDAILSKLAACAKIDKVTITGHADRLGSQQYNQTLSEKRANAVAAYLKSKGLEAPIDTHGAGKTQAITSCDDKLGHAKLIKCLSPNRRVEVTIKGQAR